MARRKLADWVPLAQAGPAAQAALAAQAAQAAQAGPADGRAALPPEAPAGGKGARAREGLLEPLSAQHKLDAVFSSARLNSQLHDIGLQRWAEDLRGEGLIVEGDWALISSADDLSPHLPLDVRQALAAHAATVSHTPPCTSYNNDPQKVI